MLRFSCLFFLFIACSTLNAQVSNCWNNLIEDSAQREGLGKEILPQEYTPLSLDMEVMKNELRLAQEGSVDLFIPMPDGTFELMRFVERSIMEQPLQDNFPEIRCYKAQSISNPSIVGNFDMTPHGFHGMIKTNEGTYFIDPFSKEEQTNYQVYFKNALPSGYKEINCSVDGHSVVDTEDSLPMDEARGTLTCNTAVLKRTYRTAVSCTGEYATFHGGTKALALAAITTTMNRVNLVYEVDFATTLILIANEMDIIYTNAGSDPYNNSNAGTLINQSQSNITSVIGTANFDVGHTFSTGAGGLAGLGVVCNNGSKAAGVTGTNNPVGDPYDIDYVAHELGHQFGSNHTFNGSTGSCSGGNRNAGTAYEPGSGSTIMAYAGICGTQNIQNNSNDYFHASSHDEILGHMINGIGANCGTSTASGNTSPQINTFTTGNTIPMGTPFFLEGAATDPNGDGLTYCWEQMNLGSAGEPNTGAGNSSPNYRSFSPSTSGIRYFPQMSDILGNTQTIGEIMSTISTTFNFRLTVRDNNSAGGGLCYQENTINVSNSSGPFVITNLNEAQLLSAGTNVTLTWDVANTTNAPVSCANVDILLSEDGGATFGTTLASGTANDGSESIVVPSIESSQVRIKIVCSDNIFFDINNADLIVSTACQLFTQDTDLTIPTTVGSVSSTLNVSGLGGVITDINVHALQGTHSYISDLTITLEHPGATSRKLFGNICNTEDDFNVKFDDDASLTTLPCPPTSGLNYKPEETLSNFNGLAPNGTWKLNIADAFNQDGGVLDSWTLLVCTDALLPLDILSFTAELDKGLPLLNWHVANALNVEKFEIHKMISGKEAFEYVGEVAFEEDKNRYSFVDQNELKKGAYYKLKVVDRDGQFRWSNIEYLSGQNVSSVLVSPSPFNDFISINFDAKTNEEYTVVVFDASGRQILSSIGQSATKMELDTRHLNEGVYFIKVLSASFNESYKLIKTN